MESISFYTEREEKKEEKPKKEQGWKLVKGAKFKTKGGADVKVEILEGITYGTKLLSITKFKKSIAIPLSDYSTLINAIKNLVEENG